MSRYPTYFVILSAILLIIGIIMMILTFKTGDPTTGLLWLSFILAFIAYMVSSAFPGYTIDNTIIDVQNVDVDERVKSVAVTTRGEKDSHSAIELIETF